MMMTTIRFPLLPAAVLVGSVLLAGSISAWAQSVVRVGPDRISIDAEEVPLVTLFNELSDIVELEMLVIDPTAEQLPVTLKADDVSVKEGIAGILDAAGVNYTIWGGNGKPFRIFAGPPESAVRSTRPEAREDPRNAEPEARDPSIDQAPSDEGAAPARVEEVPGAPGASATEGFPAAGGAVAGAAPPAPTEPEPSSAGAAERPPSPPPEPTDSTVTPTDSAVTPAGSTVTPTGNAAFVTDGAALQGEPGAAQVGLTFGLLGLGLLLGLTLVSDPGYGGRSRSKTRRQ
jgi:hypothetical protein